MTHNPKKIQICRVYTPPEKKVGVWILIDRIWPRGLKKETLDFDYWMKDIAPSADLRKWFHANPEEHWKEFAGKYKKELEKKDELITELLDLAEKKSITLFYAAKDPEHNHAIILQKFLINYSPSRSG